MKQNKTTINKQTNKQKCSIFPEASNVKMQELCTYFVKSITVVGFTSQRQPKCWFDFQDLMSQVQCPQE